jgi:BirA family transcriptional regulator, biotin operon repressor / biotin---[acetyl-CoA-carboxylase] ligase
MTIPLPLSDLNLPPLALLELLADGAVHSGRELGDALGVSRTAVWKQLMKLELLGLELDSYPGRGYCLAGGIDLLSEAAILAAVSPTVKTHIEKIEFLKIINSTNTYLLEQDPVKKIAVCLAECQTAGRGRRGRLWVSPFARNIYLSLRLTFEGGFNAIEGLSLATGVAIVRALNAVSVFDVRLKWPNDILWRSRKLGGVLIDVVGDPAGRCHVVVGIGLNIHDDRMMRALIDQPWVSLAEIAKTLSINSTSRSQITACLLNEMVPMLAQYETKGFYYYRDEWQKLNAYKEQEVEIQVGSKVLVGVLLGVNNSGALIINTQDGEHVFHGGEVTLRSIAK